MAYPHYNNIIDENIFNSYSTPEKIRFCLNKGILELQTPFYGNFVCVDYNSLDLSEFNEIDFDITQGFQIKSSKLIEEIISSITVKPNVDISGFKKTDKFYIKESVIFYNEIYNGICRCIEISSNTFSFENEIIFNLNTLPKKKAKINYLKEKIKEINPFEIPEIRVDFNYQTNKLFVSSDTEYYLMQTTSLFKINWITGVTDSEVMFYLRRYPNLRSFNDGYLKLLIVKYCYKELQSIVKDTSFQSLNTNTNDTFSLKTEKVEKRDPTLRTKKDSELYDVLFKLKYNDSQQGHKYFDVFTSVYIFQELGLLERLNDLHYFTSVEIGDILSMITGRSTDNLRKAVNLLDNKGVIGPKRKTKMKLIDKLLKTKSFG